MQHTIRGSDVFVKEDLRAIIDALDIAARHQPTGCWRDGWMAATAAMRTAVGISVEEPEIVTVTERYERYERTEQRSPAPAMPERRFAIRGEREEWPAVEPYQTQPALAMADVEFHDFVPGRGEVRRMESGWMWLGNDGTKTFYPVQQWIELSTADARRIGYLIADNRTFVLAVRSMAEARMRRLGQSVRVLPNDRRLLP